MRKWKWIIMSLCMSLLAGCNAANAAGFRTVAVQPQRLTIEQIGETDEDVQAVIEQMNTFTMEMIQNMEADNYVLSPASVYFALSCLLNGASGEAQAQLVAKLVPAGMTIESFNRACEKIIVLLMQKENCEIATLVCAQQGHKVQEAFAEAVKKSFEAEVATADFTKPDAVDAINAWAEEKTHGLIPKLFERPLSQETMLVLANSLYFKDTFITQFHAAQTSQQPFYGKLGETTVSMMMRQDGWQYYENEELQAVRLGFENGAYMDVLLPKGASTPQELLSDAAALDFSYRQGTLRLPKFDIAFEQDLQTILAKMDITHIFAGGIDRMLDTELYVSEAKQNARIHVDENGVEAAAVTTMAMRCTSAPLEDAPFFMTVDRPFAYVLYEEINGNSQILFMGVVNDIQ